MSAKKFFWLSWFLFCLSLAGEGLGGTLVTIETQKANLTLALLERFIHLEHHLRHHTKYRVLLLLPNTRTAFQDQKLVNESVLEFFRDHDIFEVKVVHHTNEVLKEIRKGSFDILYVAGLVPEIKTILREATQRGILTVSHLTELVPQGLALSLDLDRRRACILANAQAWQALSLEVPQKIYAKICFVSAKK